jgi:hypothetical protein
VSEAYTSRTDLQADYQRALLVKENYEVQLMAKANVVGVGIGMRIRGGEPVGEVSLVVMVTHKLPRSQLAPEDIVPSEIEGVSVDVQEVGEFEALG